MSRVRPGIQWVVLCALVLGLIAIGISVTQAEVGAKWTVVNKAGELKDTKKAGLSPFLEIAEFEEKDLTILTKIFGLGTKVLCTGGQLIGAKLEEEGKISSGTTLKLTECIANIGEGGTGTVCTPYDGTEAGVILSKKLNGLLVLHEGSGVLRLEPVEKKGSIINIEFNKECGLTEIPIGGILVLKDKELGTELVTHLFSQGPLTKLWAVNESNTTTIDGSMLLRLGGEHLGLRWSGTPG
jgi:hypothetical protein